MFITEYVYIQTMEKDHVFWKQIQTIKKKIQSEYQQASLIDRTQSDLIRA